MKTEIKIKSIKYFETGRGVGFNAKTDTGRICNDGNGGATYFVASCKDGHRHMLLGENELDSLIDEFEEITPEMIESIEAEMIAKQQKQLIKKNIEKLINYRTKKQTL